MKAVLLYLLTSNRKTSYLTNMLTDCCAPTDPSVRHSLTRLLKTLFLRRNFASPHPANRNVGSAIRFRFVNLSQSSKPPIGCPKASQCFDDSLPSTDSSQGLSSPVSPVLSNRSDCLRLILPHFVLLRLAIPRSCTMVLTAAFSYTKDDRSMNRLQAVFYEEIVGSPTFPQVLHCPFALFFDHGRIDVSDQYETSMLFLLTEKQKLQR